MFDCQNGFFKVQDKKNDHASLYNIHSHDPVNVFEGKGIDQISEKKPIDTSYD